MNIKAQYAEIYALLEANKNRKVSTLMPQLAELMSSKSMSSTVLKDAEGTVIAIYCYYHKKWEVLSEVEYGAKKSTSHGYNTMCKEGASKWAMQQRRAKVAREQLLEQVADGELSADDLPLALADIEESRKAIVDREDQVGSFSTEAEVLEWLAS